MPRDAFRNTVLLTSVSKLFQTVTVSVYFTLPRTQIGQSLVIVVVRPPFAKVLRKVIFSNKIESVTKGLPTYLTRCLAKFLVT